MIVCGYGIGVVLPFFCLAIRHQKAEAVKDLRL